MSTRKFRIILLLLLMTGFVSTINAQEQKISLSLNNATLKQFFNEIERKTDYSFSYREGVLDNRKDITVSVKNTCPRRKMEEMLYTGIRRLCSSSR